MYKVPQLNTFNTPKTFVPQVDYYPLPPYYAPPPYKTRTYHYPGSQEYRSPYEQYYLNQRNYNNYQQPYNDYYYSQQEDPNEFYYNYDEVNEPVPIIYFQPPQFQPQIRSEDYGYPKGYLEIEQQNQRKEQFTEHIQNQLKYGQKLQPKSKKDLRKRWEIKNFYLPLEASVNEKGLVSFNNYKYYEQPQNQVYFETEPQEASMEEEEVESQEEQEAAKEEKEEKGSKKQGEEKKVEKKKS